MAGDGQPTNGGQRRGRRIAMSAEERDAFLTSERVCRVATSSPDGPHNTPLWYVWDGTSLWLNSIVRSQRWTDMQRDPRVAVVVDAGHGFGELRGVELRGCVVQVGEAPRRGEPNDELADIERMFAVKYTGAETLHYDGRHGWLKLTPTKSVSWDFRKG